MYTRSFMALFYPTYRAVRGFAKSLHSKVIHAKKAVVFSVSVITAF